MPFQEKSTLFLVLMVGDVAYSFLADAKFFCSGVFSTYLHTSIKKEMKN